jgi:hypothetical protein
MDKTRIETNLVRILQPCKTGRIEEAGGRLEPSGNRIRALLPADCSPEATPNRFKALQPCKTGPRVMATSSANQVDYSRAMHGMGGMPEILKESLYSAALGAVQYVG